jgi:hypothetical protein
VRVTVIQNSNQLSSRARAMHRAAPSTSAPRHSTSPHRPSTRSRALAADTRALRLPHLHASASPLPHANDGNSQRRARSLARSPTSRIAVIRYSTSCQRNRSTASTPVSVAHTPLASRLASRANCCMTPVSTPSSPHSSCRITTHRYASLRITTHHYASLTCWQLSRTSRNSDVPQDLELRVQPTTARQRSAATIAAAHRFQPSVSTLDHRPHQRHRVSVVITRAHVSTRVPTRANLTPLRRSSPTRPRASPRPRAGRTHPRAGCTRSRVDRTPSRVHRTPSRVDRTPSRVDHTLSRVDRTHRRASTAHRRALTTHTVARRPHTLARRSHPSRANRTPPRADRTPIAPVAREPHSAAHRTHAVMRHPHTFVRRPHSAAR